jgi:hypothetical protein
MLWPNWGELGERGELIISMIQIDDSRMKSTGSSWRSHTSDPGALVSRVDNKSGERQFPSAGPRSP